MTERRSVEARGKNVDEAIQKGLAQLGVRRDQVDVQVISEGSRGILGIGAEDARVRLTVVAAPAAPAPKAPAAPAPEVSRPAPVPAPAPAPRPEPVVVSAPAAEAAPAAAAPAPLEPSVSQTVEDLALTTVRDMLQQMGAKAQITIQLSPPADEGEDAAYLVDVRGSNLQNLIGKRGEVLDSLQYLTRLIVQHKSGHWVSIIVDVDGYRERRAETLRATARQMADRVKRDGRSISLDPMPPYERRIIHLALRSDPDVMTVSVGEGDNRKVTIRPKH
ncbi:MAG: RNA-binding cell elongation regulator Jag/EloR [Anaerolineae bacterium]